MEILSILFALVLSNGYMFMTALSLEPTCSKFDYEIRSLEAMLRTEHKVEKMLEEMKALKEASLKDLSESKAFREVTKTEIGELKAEMDKTMIEKDGDVGEKLETITRKTDEKLLAIEAALEQIASKSGELTDSIVAFSVTNPTKLTVNGVPTFSIIITNTGGGYDTTTGVFTSPVDGVYLFLFTVGSYGKNDVYCWIRHNDESKVFGRSYNDNSYTTASASVILMLSKGDRVNPGGCIGWSKVYHSDKATTFSGTLLKQANVD